LNTSDEEAKIQNYLFRGDIHPGGNCVSIPFVSSCHKLIEILSGYYTKPVPVAEDMAL
jgi:hypothetical protein